MPASIDNALTTLARLKSFLEISGSSKDFRLTMIINATSKFVENECNRTFKHETITDELYDGANNRTIVLRKSPLVPGSSVTLKSRSTIFSNELDEGDWRTVDGSKYFADENTGIITMPSLFRKGKQNYRVTYTAGYYLPSETQFQDGTDDNLDLPYDLEYAVLKLCNYEYNNKRFDVSSTRVRDVAITYKSYEEKDKEIARVLNAFKKFVYA